MTVKELKEALNKLNDNENIGIAVMYREPNSWNAKWCVINDIKVVKSCTGVHIQTAEPQPVKELDFYNNKR